MNRKHFRRHKTEYIFGAIACVAAIFSHSDIQNQMNALSMDRARISESTSQTRQLEESAEAAKSRAAIAIQRYKDGCTIVVATRSPKNLATLILGEPVLDRTTKKPLPVGTVVCDINGSTGVIVKSPDGQPVVGEMAFTGNRDLALAQVRKIRGAKVYYFTPEK